MPARGLTDRDVCVCVVQVVIQVLEKSAAAVFTETLQPHSQIERKTLTSVQKGR